jgi:isopenicillin-N epimerase
MNQIKNKFLLNPDMTYLNHGSFGACPKSVFEDYQNWQKKLEFHPVHFLTETLYKTLYESRRSLSEFVGCDEDEIIFFQNPTTAVTNIIHNLNVKHNDEILMTNHEYGALVRAWLVWAKKSGAKIVQQEISTPVSTEEKFMDDFWKGVTSRTKVIFISQITSSTGLIFPIASIIKMAKEKGILTIVDGAHVPAHIPLDIHKLGCDFYAGACHKWLCGPKGASFLFVKKEHQDWIKPLIVSWGNSGDDPGPSEFLTEFNWQGTRDMSSFLAIPAAIKFYVDEIKSHQETCRNIIQTVYYDFQNVLKTDPISTGGNWLGQMVSHPLPKRTPKNFKKKLWDDTKIEIPIFTWNETQFIRISIQVYNSQKDVDFLMSALRSYF